MLNLGYNKKFSFLRQISCVAKIASSILKGTYPIDIYLKKPSALAQWRDWLLHILTKTGIISDRWSVV